MKIKIRHEILKLKSESNNSLTHYNNIKSKINIPSIEVNRITLNTVIALSTVTFLHTGT